jgi:hypothetical protein
MCFTPTKILSIPNGAVYGLYSSRIGSPDLLTSCVYIGHLLTIRRERFLEFGGLSSDYGNAHLLDLMLRRR